MTTPFRVLDIDHVVLRTADPARLEDFYTRVLGCPLVKRQERIGLTQLRAGRALIDILAVRPEEAATAPHGSAAGNMDHLCLRIDPFDAEAVRRHFAAHGVAVGDTVSRFGAEGSGPSLYLEDPEGNRLELKGPPSEGN
jgi:catechol 2,3-dioxygenase-like lactoylglutathione lyase family enzyme